MAQNVLWLGRAQMCNEGLIADGSFECRADEYNKEPNGFPFLLSLAFRVAGVSERAAHHLNHAVFALGALAVYWLAGMVFQKVSVAVGAATAYVAPRSSAVRRLDGRSRCRPCSRSTPSPPICPLLVPWDLSRGGLERITTSRFR